MIQKETEERLNRLKDQIDNLKRDAGSGCPTDLGSDDY